MTLSLKLVFNCIQNEGSPVKKSKEGCSPANFEHPLNSFDQFCVLVRNIQE